jgi:hypothetical protein
LGEEAKQDRTTADRRGGGNSLSSIADVMTGKQLAWTGGCHGQLNSHIKNNRRMSRVIVVVDKGIIS